MTSEEFTILASTFPDIQEAPHFDKSAFKVKGKKIIATLDHRNNLATLKLSLEGQKEFCTFNLAIVYPVKNKWGQQGWTIFDLTNVPRKLMKEALHTAYNGVVKKSTKKK